MTKYYLLIAGIVFTFLGELFEKEKEKNEKIEFRIKSFTKAGLILIVVGFFLSAFGVYQTFEDERKTKLENKIKITEDSLRFERKNFTDYVRYKSIINKLIDNQGQLLKETDNIVSTTIGESHRQLVESNKNRFLIPEYFIVTFELKLDINPKEIEIAENEIFRLYKSEISRDFKTLNGRPVGGGIGLISLQQKGQTNSKVLEAFQEMSNSFLNCGIFFKDNKMKTICAIQESSVSNIRNWQTIKFKTENYMDEVFIVVYNFDEKRFSIRGQRLKINTNKTPNAGSLIDLLGKRLEFNLEAYYVNQIAQFELSELIIDTPDKNTLILKNFKKNSNTKFFKILGESDIWK
jgi:hypothetical protein